MGYFTNKTQKIIAFCMPLAYHLAPIANNLDNINDDEFNYLDDDCERDYFVKYNLFYKHIDNFFKRNPGLYNEENLREEIYQLFK